MTWQSHRRAPRYKRVPRSCMVTKILKGVLPIPGEYPQKHVRAPVSLWRDLVFVHLLGKFLRRHLARQDQR